MEIIKAALLARRGEQPALFLRIWHNCDTNVIVDWKGGNPRVGCPPIRGMSPAEAEDLAAALMEAARLAREGEE